MQEFTTVSSSSFDPSALATKLTDKSADGWSVVSIVSTGGDVTAFLCRESASSDDSVQAMSSLDRSSASASTSAGTGSSSASFTPAPAPEPAVSEPAGWAVAPEPSLPVAPIVDPVPSYSSAPTQSYTATPSYTPAPAAAAPAVPAGWYADPAGRFELRYWDGGTWTEHVSRAGQQYTDPPVA